MPGGASGGPSVPRSAVSGPFRGHLSMKSNAFCIGQSSRLSDQYRIRDHMIAHYNKILTAKAAVDCSVPKSLTKSIKYNDQQRRERLKTAVTRIERESLPSRASSSRPHSRESLQSALQQKDLYDGYCNTLRQSPYSDPGASPTSFISSHRRFHSSEHAADFRRRHPDLSRPSSRVSGSSAWGANAHKFQDNHEKTYSGDLIEKHAHHFTCKERLFTPRTLKTPAKSVLAQSRFYTPPRRKRKGQRSEAEVQTDLSSFRGRLGSTHRILPLDEAQVEDPENILLSEDEADSDRHLLSASRMSYAEFNSPSPTMQRIRSEEDELAYLGFVADVTNEILSLGLFSDRVLDRVFEHHLEVNRHRLDEVKMRHLLDTLRADLDSKEEKKLDFFVEHNFSTSRHFRDPFAFPLANKSEGFHSQDFSVGDYKSHLRYLNGKDEESRLQDNVQTGLDGEDNLGLSGSLTCIGKRDSDHNNVLNGGEDFETAQQSLEAAIYLPENELDTSKQNEDFLPLQDDQKETYSESQNNTQLSEKMSPMDDVLPEDLDGNQRSSSQMGLLELNHDLKMAHEPRDLEDLEQSFSKIILVSKAEDGSVQDEENEHVSFDHEDVSDQDDF